MPNPPIFSTKINSADRRKDSLWANHCLQSAAFYFPGRPRKQGLKLPAQTRWQLQNPSMTETPTDGPVPFWTSDHPTAHKLCG